MNYLIEFLTIFLLAVLIIALWKRKKYFKKKEFQKENFLNDSEVLYLRNINNVDIEKIDVKKFIFAISITDAICISTVYILFIIIKIDNLVLKMLFLFVGIVVMIMLSYFILSLFYKKVGKENENPRD